MKIGDILTIDQKIAILKYLRGKWALTDNFEYYESLDNNPYLKLRPKYLYLSSLLSVDYEKDIESSSETAELCKKFGVNENLNTNQWHIADAISEVMFDFFAENKDKIIDIYFTSGLDSKICDLFNSYKDLISDSTTGKCQYVKAGVSLSGHGELYYKKELK